MHTQSSWSKFRASILCNVLIEQTSFSSSVSVCLYICFACVWVCVCAVSAITLTIQHTKESCFDDTSCRVCTIRLNSVCRCMRDRAKYFGNEYKKLHYFHLVNTAFIWPVNVSFFFVFLNKWERELEEKIQFYLSVHFKYKITEDFFFFGRPFTKILVEVLWMWNKCA